MNAEALLANYERIADAPSSISRLRRLVLELAVRGRLVPQDPLEIQGRPLQRVEGEGAFAIPQNWRWSELRTVANVEMGQSPPSEHYNQNCNGIPFFQGKADFGAKHPTARYWCSQPSKMAEPGDILISVRAPVGPTNVADVQCCIGRGLAALRVNDRIDREFFLLSLKALEFDLVALGFGTTFAAINKKHLTTFQLPVPPLAEQLRIVAKVDELMALCDQLEEARMEREVRRDRLAAASFSRLNAPDPENFPADATFALNTLPPLTARADQIRQLRQTILNLAVRGMLTRQEPADEPAAELLKRIAAEREQLVKAGEIRKGKSSVPVLEEEQSFVVPSGWTWTRLAEVGVTRTGTSPSSSNPDLFGNFIPFVKPSALDGATIDYTGPGLSREGMAYSRVAPANSVLMVCIGATLGKINVTDREVCFNQQINSLTPYIGGMYGFLALALKAPDFQKNAWARAGTGTLPIISKGKWERLPIALPTLAEQSRIVTKVRDLMVLCDQLEVSLAGADETRYHLLDALLAKALHPVP